LIHSKSNSIEIASRTRASANMARRMLNTSARMIFGQP